MNNDDIFSAETFTGLAQPAEQLFPEDLDLCLKGLPPGVRDTLKDSKCCVAGGYIRDTINSDTPKDIDIFTDSELSARVIANRLFTRAHYFRQNGRNREIVETGKALSIVGGYKGPMPQVIFKWVFEDMSKVIDAFDFTIVQAAFWWDGERFVSRCAPTFYGDLEKQRLEFTSPEGNDELGSILRVMKFYRAGYSIDNANLSRVLADFCASLSNDLSSEGVRKSILSQLPNRGDGKY